MTPTGLEEPAKTRGKHDADNASGNTGGNTPVENRLIQAFRRLSIDDQKRLIEIVNSMRRLVL